VQTTESQKIKDYLLGRAPEIVQADVEQRLLADDQFFEELTICEDELVDQYLLGRLTEAEKMRFESYFLIAPERRERLRFGNLLNKYLESQDRFAPIPVRRKSKVGLFWPLRRPVMAYSLIACLVLALAAGWVWYQVRTISPRQTLTVTLSPGEMRSGGSVQRVVVTKDVGQLEIRLSLPNANYETYAADVYQESSRVESFQNLQPFSQDGQRVVVLKIKAPDSAGDYQIKLSGKSPSGQLEPISSYNLRVLRD